MTQVDITDSVMTKCFAQKSGPPLKVRRVARFGILLVAIAILGVARAIVSEKWDGGLGLGNNPDELQGLHATTGLDLMPQLASVRQEFRDRGGTNCRAAEDAGQIQFQEVTNSAGLSHTTVTFGASWGDFDGDGRPDLWVGNHATHPSLYLNQGDGTFVDIASSVWSASPDADTHGAAWGDFDNDGDQDLIELVGAQHGTGEGSNHLFVNDGGVFTEQATDLGIDYPLGRGRTPLWLDWSRDGRLDVLLANFARLDDQAPSALFEQIASGFQETSVGFAAPGSSEFGQLADLSGDGRLDLIIHGFPYPQRVYDIGSIPFEDLTNIIGLQETSWTKDVIIADFDGNLHSDLYMVRLKNVSDFVQVDDNTILVFFVLRQEENGISFQTTGDVLFYPSDPRLESSYIFIGSEGHHPPTCCSFTLSPQDPTVIGIQEHIPGSDPGIYIGYDPVSQVWQLLASAPGYAEFATVISTTAPISTSTAIGFDPSARSLYDRLLLHKSGVFEDQTVAAGLVVRTGCHSGAAGDFDNDTDVDLYLVCGRPVTHTPNILYENQNDGTFIAVPGAGGAAGSSLGSGESVAVADYDGDGFLDLFVTNGEEPLPGGPYQLFRNLGNGNHWLEIDLVGNTSNRDGIGSRVLATTGSITQLREQGGGMHNRAQNHQRIHFGLGSNTQVDRLVIRWPSGIVQEFKDITANQVLQIAEPSLEPHSYLPIVLK